MKLKLTKTADQIAAVRNEKRRNEYPPLADFADAVYWRDKGDEAPWKAYVARVDAVKAKYPKG